MMVKAIPRIYRQKELKNNPNQKAQDLYLIFLP